MGKAYDTKFHKFLERYRKSDNCYGDFARDALSDYKMPHTRRQWLKRLTDRFACEEAVDAFKYLWEIYESEQKGGAE